MKTQSILHWRKEFILALNEKNVSRDTALILADPLKECTSEEEREKWAEQVAKIVLESTSEEEMLEKCKEKRAV